MKGFSTMQVFLYIFQIGKVRLPYKMAAVWEGGRIQVEISHRKGKFTIQVYSGKEVGRI